MSQRQTSQGFLTKFTSVFVGNEDKFYFQVLHNFSILFKISYFTCVTPFCIKRSKNGVFKIHTNKVQQVLTAILNTLAFLCIFRNVQLLIQDDEHSIIEDPKHLFKWLMCVSRIAVAIVAIYLFWFRKNALKKLLSHLQDGKDTEQVEVGSTIMKLAICLWILHTLIGNLIIHLLLVYENPPLPHNETFVTIQLFNLDPSQYSDLNGDLLTEIRIAEVFLLILKFYSVFMQDISILIVLTCSVMIYQTCKGFNNRLRSESRNIGQVLQHYGEVKRQIEIINDFVGLLLFVYVLELIFRSLHLPFEFSGESTHERVTIFIFLVKGFSILFIAGEANAKVSCLKNWLFNYKFQELTSEVHYQDDIGRNGESKDAFRLLKWDCNRKVGLGCKLFIVTYGSIGMLLGVLATYGAVQLQFYSAATNEASCYSALLSQSDFYDPKLRNDTTVTTDDLS